VASFRSYGAAENERDDVGENKRDGGDCGARGGEIVDGLEVDGEEVD
jgi:hypothetical protein